MLAILALGAVMALGMAWLNLINGAEDPASFVVFAGWGAFTVFAALTAFGLWQLLTTRGPVVTLTATGITDTRAAADEIPWRAIGDIGVWSLQRTKMIVLSVDPDVEAQLKLTGLARMSRRANAKLGADGLVTQSNNLKITHDASLKEIVRRHAEDTAHATAPAS